MFFIFYHTCIQPVQIINCKYFKDVKEVYEYGDEIG